MESFHSYSCISTRLRLVTILTLLVKYLDIFHADPCNKSYYMCMCVYIILILHKSEWNVASYFMTSIVYSLRVCDVFCKEGWNICFITYDIITYHFKLRILQYP